MKSSVVENRNVIFASVLYSKALSWANREDEEVQICLGIHAGDHCFSKNTEILTPDRGIISFKDLKVGDSVFSFNLEKNTIERDVCIDIIQKNKVELINKIITTAGTIELTDEHKVYRIKYDNFHKVYGWNKSIEECKVGDLRVGDYLVSPTDIKYSFNTEFDSTIDLLPICREIIKKYDKCDIVEKDSRLMISSRGVTNNGKHRTMTLPRICNKKTLFSLLSWYITEGWSSSISKEESKSGQSRFFACLSQSMFKNPHKCDYIMGLIQELGIGYSPIEYSIEKQNNLPKEITFNFSGIVSLLMKECGFKSYDKHIPEWMFNEIIKDRDLTITILDNLIEGDGYRDLFLNGIYASTSLALIKQVAFLANIIGLHVTLSYPRNGSKCYYLSMTRLGRKVGAVAIGEARFTKVLSIEKEKYGDFVYDMSIQRNHNFFAGDLGQILISNSIYPDCRQESRDALAKAFQISNWGSEKISYYTPFIDKNKTYILKEIFDVCSNEDLDLHYILKNTNTCYQPDKRGRACGRCGSCIERIEAFLNLDLIDPVSYQEDWGTVIKRISK